MNFATILNYAEYPSYYDQLVAQVSNSYLYVTGKFTNKFINDLVSINITNFNYAQYSYSGITYYQTYLLYDLLEKKLYSVTNIPQLIPNLIAMPIYKYNDIIFTSYEILINWFNTIFLQNNSSTLLNINIDTSTTNLDMQLLNAFNNTVGYVPQVIQHHTNVYFSNSVIYLSYPYNITNWSTTYSLSLYQSLIISFTNCQTLFIPIQMTGNDVYRLYLTQNISSYNSGGTTQSILLYPNNNTITNIYTEFAVFYNSGSTTYSNGNAILSGFRLGVTLGSTDATIINNSPFTKTVIFKDVELGSQFSPITHLAAQIWNDYTTSWTMFGTISLPQPAAGFLCIKRVK